MAFDPGAIGVVGAGVMGTGVAACLGSSNLPVILVDVNDELLHAAEQEISRGVRMRSLLSGGGGQSSPRSVLSRITLTTDLNALHAATFVIENITERWQTKEELYVQLDRICRPNTIIAANTSVISITRLAALTSRPNDILGMHFMNPVPLKRTVEIIRAYSTSEETIAAAMALLAQMGKEGVVVADSPGFVTNRVMMPTINESVFLLHERVATAKDIDRLFRECMGHKMGPLETADLIGLDTVLLSIEALYESFNDSKYRPCPLLKQMVHAGLLGRKSGQGFYTYHSQVQSPAEQGTLV